MEQHGIKTGTVFTIGGGTDEYVVSDLVTHFWNVNAKRVEALPDPDVVFRSVANINSMKPVHEQIKMPLSLYKTDCKIKPLTTRK
jgi:hypothetical protein